MRKYLRTLAVAGAVVGLAVTACGSPPPEDTSSEKTGSDAGGANEDFRACMVSDSGGFDDKSFNQTSYKGLQEAVEEYGIVESKLESQSDNDYPNNIAAMVQQDCNIIITVGFKLGDATYKAAKQNPNIDFAIVDYAYDPKKQPPLDNLKSLLFNTAQPSFMAGYLAAGMSQTGKVGTFGGIKIPTVTIFMDGFWEGVQYYNQQKNKNVEVLGWNEPKQDGAFTNDFEDKNKGRNAANNLISQGADIIYPVAGPAGIGGLQAVQDSGKADAIWVDTDGCISAATYCPDLLTSVNKAMDVAVKASIESALDNRFDNTPYVGTLDNNGVSLAPYHEFEDKIPGQLKKEIQALESDLTSGKIELQSKAQPEVN